jgi:hypothetical protein
VRRPSRPGPLAAVGLLLLVLVACAGWIGLTALRAQSALEDARASLVAARDALAQRDLDVATAAVEDAGEATGRARRATSGPVWALGAAVPGYGKSLQVVRGLAAAADDVASGVLPSALEAARTVDPDRLRSPDGVVDTAVLRAATPPVVAGADQAERVLSDLVALPEADVVGVLGQARGELAAEVDELARLLRGAATALEVAPALLGEDRERRYLVLVQQTAESRGTGGLIGGFVEVVASGGRLSAVSSGSNTHLRNGAVPVPEDVPADFADIYGDAGAFAIWQNVNLSPDLPVVARVVEARWAAQGGAPLDGVVMVDATALALVLAGSGPVPLPEGGEVAPEELPEYLAVGQYRGVPLTRDGALTRKDRLEDLAALATARLTSGGGDTLALLRGLAAAVRSGHLQMASEDPALQPVLRSSGLDHALPAGDGPVAYPVVWNATGGKLDHFLDRDVVYRAGRCTDGRRRSTIAVTLTNRAPEDLPEYLTIRVTPEGRTASRTAAVTLQVYGTPGADLVRATVDGRPVAPEDPLGLVLFNVTEAGLPMWYLGLDLPPDEPRTLVLELDEPVVAGAPVVPEQPLSRPLTRTVDVPACG